VRCARSPSPYCSAALSCVFANCRCAFAGERLSVSGSSDCFGFPLLVVFGMPFSSHALAEENVSVG
jgi:hypothetical protein